MRNLRRAAAISESDVASAASRDLLRNAFHWAFFWSSSFCCCWALKSRNILGVMGWHSGWNWILAVGFGLPLSGLDVGIPALLVTLQPTGENWRHGGIQGPEGSIVCVIYFIAFSAWLLWSLRRKPRDVAKDVNDVGA